MERKELKPIYARFAQEWIEGEDGDLYIREEADAVMDAMEARIKELEEQLLELSTTIKNASAVYESMLNDLDKAETRIKELGTELGTQLGTQLQQSVTNCNKWVSVKDRLPTECESVLVYYAKFNEYGIAWVESVEDEKEWCNGEYNFPIDSYTHWMSLPKPPTVSKSENVATAEDSSDAGGDNA